MFGFRLSLPTFRPARLRACQRYFALFFLAWAAEGARKPPVAMQI
jgi:hypothetical protein